MAEPTGETKALERRYADGQSVEEGCMSNAKSSKERWTTK